MPWVALGNNSTAMYSSQALALAHADTYSSSVGVVGSVNRASTWTHDIPPPPPPPQDSHIL